jgi:iron complex transport system substrate-binding protein
MRIVSLLPSATEIVAALGLGDQLVGRSAECDWPPMVRDLPVVTAARISSDELASAEIDRAVRDTLLEGGSLYALDEGLVQHLQPDLVITQDLCSVCAVSGEDVRRMERLSCDVLSLDPRTVGEVELSIWQIADRAGVCGSAEAVISRMRRTIWDAARAVEGMRPRRVVVLEWLDPPFACGHWVPEMVDMAGGVELLGEAGSPSRPVSWDDVRAAEPELLVLAPCGFDAERAAREAEPLDLPFPAVAVDANAYFARPAPRLADGVAQLAHLFHPEAAPDPGLPARHLTAAPAWGTG